MDKDYLVAIIEKVMRGESESRTQDVFNDVMKQKRGRNDIDARRANAKADLTKQKERLLQLKYPELTGIPNGRIVELFDSAWKIIDERKEFGKNLFIVPESLLLIPQKLSLVEWKGRRGVNYLDLSELRNAKGVETPQVPYLLLDVEDGRAMKNVSPDNCMMQFKREGRLGLTVNEGIMLITHHFEILDDHFVDCPGSRFGSNYVPCICLGAFQVALYYSDSAHSTERWGSASCGSRILGFRS